MASHAQRLRERRLLDSRSLPARLSAGQVQAAVAQNDAFLLVQSIQQVIHLLRGD